MLLNVKVCHFTLYRELSHMVAAEARILSNELRGSQDIIERKDEMIKELHAEVSRLKGSFVDRDDYHCVPNLVGNKTMRSKCRNGKTEVSLHLAC